MGKNILLLTDYKGFFGSKQLTNIYRGGMDINKLLELFRTKGFFAEVKKIVDVDMNKAFKNYSIVLYTSSEDKNWFYKSFIEDIIFHLEESGLTVLPKFAYLKAHNNKVAMELLRERSEYKPIQTIRSKVFGTIEELEKNIHSFKYPVVIKAAAGAMSKGVVMANNPKELLRKAKKVSRSFHFFHDSKELLRKLKYRSRYVRESFYRKKFIVQNYIKGLSNDWKVLVYGNKCYVLYRGNRKDDFRASGSGNFVFKKELPDGLLDFAWSIEKHFNVPHISLDIGFDGRIFHLIEFQFLYFGTTTIEKAPFYFEKIDSTWSLVEKVSDLEETYIESIVDFLGNKVAL
ncbi:ATP-grasp domain-containing protein [Calditrichota bacterium LG25]